MKMRIACVLSLLLISACQTPAGPAAQQEQQESSAVTSSSDAQEAQQQASQQPVVVEVSSGDFDPLNEIAEAELPDSALLDVPFTSQAPFANWDPPYDEACEEASFLMVEFALRGEALSKERADQEIVAMAAWEEDHGYPIDVTVAQLSEIIRELFGRETAMYTGEKVTTDNIKRLLAAGYPVIIPAAGQQLGNPYFSGDGPPYHMLVIIGYDDGGVFSGPEFITNDPGTKRGESYRYSVDVIDRVIHDWTGDKETITQGQRAMLVVEA